MGQDFVLSSILSTLYIVPIIYIFELRAQAFNLNIYILSFVDNSLLISQGKIYNTTLPDLHSSYRVVIELIVLFGLVMEHDKLEIFYFSRVYNNSNQELDLSAISIPILKLKIYWRYWAFTLIGMFSLKNMFITILLLKAMNILGNLTRGLLPLQKWLLYCSCFFITIYDFWL